MHLEHTLIIHFKKLFMGNWKNYQKKANNFSSFQKKFLKFQWKQKGLLTSIMAPEASVRVGEMSSKSRLQINSKKKKKFPVFSRQPNKGTKEREKEKMNYRRSLPEGWSNSKSKSKSNWEVSFWFWISLLLFIWSN